MSKKINRNKQITTMEVSEIISFFALGKLNLEVISQRYYVWDVDAVKDLIDTFTNDFPLPSIAVTLNSGKFDVLDGKQRLVTTLAYVLGNKMLDIYNFSAPNSDAIKAMLEKINDPDNKIIPFDDLGATQQNAILEFRIPVVILEIKDSKDKEKLNVKLFDRLNRGMIPLSKPVMFVSGIASKLLDTEDIKNIYDVTHKEMYGVMSLLKVKQVDVKSWKTIDDIRNIKIMVDFEKAGKSIDGLRFKHELDLETDSYVAEDNAVKANETAKKVAESYIGSVKKILFELSKRPWLHVKMQPRDLNFALYLILSGKLSLLDAIGSIDKLKSITKSVADDVKASDKSGISTPTKVKWAFEKASSELVK